MCCNLLRWGKNRSLVHDDSESLADGLICMNTVNGHPHGKEANA